MTELTPEQRKKVADSLRRMAIKINNAAVDSCHDVLRDNNAPPEVLEALLELKFKPGDLDHLDIGELT